MYRNFNKICLFLFASVFIYNCAYTFIDKSYRAADSLIKKSSEDVTNVKSMIVASLVNIDNLEESNALGRLISEQIASRLSQRGYHVKEIKLSSSEFIKREALGEKVLSYRPTNHNSSLDIDYIIIGTYSVAYHSIYVSARIVNITSNKIVSSYDYVISIDNDIRALLMEE